MNIRPATPGDSDAIVGLLAELREAPQSYDKTMAASLSSLIDDPDRTALLVIDGTETIGMAVINIVYKLPKREARIDEVVVAESARGHGVGTILIEACETWAREHDVDTIEFTSRASRAAANHLYQKLGYQIRDTNVYQKNRGDF